MNKNLYSNTEFTELKKRLNQEILRRGTYKWWDPLSTPKVGLDTSSPESLPDIGVRVPVNDNTYTINNPSSGSIEKTRNIKYPANGETPAGGNPSNISSVPNTSAAQFNIDEIKNMLVGLSKIDDINLFYGRDEEEGLAYRDPSGIIQVLENAESDHLNIPLRWLYEFKLEDGNLILIWHGKGEPEIEINENGEVLITINDETYINTLHFTQDHDDGDLLMNDRICEFRLDNGELVMDWYGNTDPSYEINDAGELILYSNDRFLSAFRFFIDEDNCLLVIDQDGNAYSKWDPNTGIIDHMNANYPDQSSTVFYEFKINDDGYFTMPSGERDGEEAGEEGLGPHNFFDDYGAKPGDGNYHPVNPGTTPAVHRDWYEYDKDRKPSKIVIIQGGVKKSIYGQNPRNPADGNEYSGIPVFAGVPGTCHSQCTGLCYTTCDAQCSESCMSSCFSRCGNACTSNCGNVCTGCNTLCYTSCKTKCEQISGFSCLHAGAKAVKIYTSGGSNGEPAVNHLDVEKFVCDGCQYTCQFYPNKKTECWDSGCMGKCFTSCTTACSTSCLGGCINNDAGDGKGQGCSAGCTINCAGVCQGTCEGLCTDTCFHQCKETCSDNCTWICDTTCGAGCDTGCKNGCKGCDGTCESYCTGYTDMYGCVGCGTKGGCTSTCQFDCNENCINKGCTAMCGTGGAGACTNNCRINCMATSCTSQCSDQCTLQCNSCVNSCGWQCGACSSLCSNGCEGECEITCTATCQHSCSMNCVHSCTEECGGCSGLCYSCVGMCIGVCSQKCDSNCSSCSNLCSWWCDVQCSQECMTSCKEFCMLTCSGNCATYVGSDSKLAGPEQGPTAIGYTTPNPVNRVEERESFKLFHGKEDPSKLKFHLSSEGNLIATYNGTDDIEHHIDIDGNLIINIKDKSALSFEMSKYTFEVDDLNNLNVFYSWEYSVKPGE